MSAVYLGLIPSIISFVIVAKILPRDWKNAELRNIELAENN
jgi:hypothetical protein